MEAKKLCLVGNPNSGRTSWFAPFQGIISVKAIASVTREKQFATHKINQETQVVFIDEWSSDSMCAENAKRVLQGGIQILPQKHKEASICIYQKGFFITTNAMPNFGQGLDAEAISTQLAVFQTEPLKCVRHSCTRRMRKNCMPIFHYCGDVLKDEPLFSDNESNSESDGNNSDEGAKYNDFDRKEHSLLDIADISECNFSLDVFQSEISSIIEEVAIEVVPEQMMDDNFLARDEEHPEPWQRHHDLVIYEGDINM